MNRLYATLECDPVNNRLPADMSNNFDVPPEVLKATRADNSIDLG
jgi:hypothetical protein